MCEHVFKWDGVWKAFLCVKCGRAQEPQPKNPFTS